MADDRDAAVNTTPTRWDASMMTKARLRQDRTTRLASATVASLLDDGTTPIPLDRATYIKPVPVLRRAVDIYVTGIGQKVPLADPD